MTHPLHPNITAEVVQALAESGFDGMAQVMQLLLNECMKIERQQALGVGPYQRGEARQGQANGFKPKTVKTPHRGDRTRRATGPRRSRFIRRRWNVARAARKPCAWRSPRCTCKASRPTR